ncbi:DUF421 domain-containing protein [Christiangramia salexigens]|uniref:DUF421 domain-containing protein n=1 Tax=Christiangramia salexigens TaxID=1913577 RepID=A0A1L3J5X0_9FLAO|nr:YetF domain-containing protein [Christiangramia salexigens]APG60525.1 hypothetical protein LPB144_08965 [Christiangramia salexigens]
MEKWFTTDWQALLAIIITATGIYAAVILFTRLAGKRSFSKMSSFDFAMTVAVGSIIATTVLSKNISLLDGIVGLAAIYLLQIGVALLRRFKPVRIAVDNSPLLLMEEKKIFYDNLKKARVSEDDLRSKLREANVTSLGQVRAVVFETTGDISVLHTDDEKGTLEDWLIKDVDRF